MKPLEWRGGLGLGPYLFVRFVMAVVVVRVFAEDSVGLGFL